MTPIDLAVCCRFLRSEGSLDDCGIAQKHVELDQHQLSHGDVGTFAARLQEGASLLMFLAVAIRGVEKQIRVDRDHSRSLTERRGVIGQLTPLSHGRSEPS